jgi:dTMP kinase
MTGFTSSSPSLTPRGYLVAVDGPAGVGKTTVTALAAARLAASGTPVLATR